MIAGQAKGKAALAVLAQGSAANVQIYVLEGHSDLSYSESEMTHIASSNRLNDQKICGALKFSDNDQNSINTVGLYCIKLEED